MVSDHRQEAAGFFLYVHTSLYTAHDRLVLRDDQGFRGLTLHFCGKIAAQPPGAR